MGRWAYPATTLAAVAIGWVVARLGTLSSQTLLIAVGIATAGFIGISAKLAIDRFAAIANTADDEAEYPEPTLHRGPRWLYYAGMFTMPLIAVRFQGTTLSDYLFLAALVLLICSVAPYSNHTPSLPPPLLLTGVGLFLAGALLATLLHSIDPIGSAAIAARVAYLLVVWIALAMMVLRTPQHVRTAVQCWVAGAAACALYAIAQKAGLATSPLASAGRFTGLTEHPNDLGAVCAVAFAPALMLLYTTRNPAYAGFGVVLVAGISVSGSITAAAAALLALLVCGIARGITTVLVIAVLGGVTLVYVTPPDALRTTPIGRFQQATTEGSAGGSDTLYSRLEVIGTAWEHIKADPWIGTGLDRESASILSFNDNRFVAVHNLFIARWYETGLLGLAGILVVVWAFVRFGWRAIRFSRGTDQLLAIGLLASTIAFLVVAMADPLLYKRYTLAGATLSITLVAISLRRTGYSRTASASYAPPAITARSPSPTVRTFLG